jgi:hypothetical protein
MMTRPGRHRLADGSLIKLDMERGQYVGSLYRCDLTVRKVVVGTQEYVTQQMREWRKEPTLHNIDCGRGLNHAPGSANWSAAPMAHGWSHVTAWRTK